jgi:hypothetical protein
VFICSLELTAGCAMRGGRPRRIAVATIGLTSTQGVRNGQGCENTYHETRPQTRPGTRRAGGPSKADDGFLRLAREADASGDEDDPGLARAKAMLSAADWILAETEPTTVAGAAAVLACITHANPVGLFDVGECTWHETALMSRCRRSAGRNNSVSR